AYLLLFFILLSRWLKTYSYTRNIQTRGLEKIDIEWKMFVKKMSHRLGIRQEIKIYISHLVSSPLTVGFIKPVILIPLASINNLSPEQMEAVILHELAHIKRFDYLVNLILSVIELALFFNPFTQLISRIIKKERENSCDDWVLQFQYQPAMYAEALLRIAYLQNSPALAMHAVHNKQDLLFRVKRMVEKKEKFNYKQQLLALFLLTGIFCSIAWFQPAAVSKNNKAKNTKSVFLEPLASKVSNPLMNPLFFLAKPLNDEVKKVSDEARRHVAQAELARTMINLEVPSIPPAVAQQLKEINSEKFKRDLEKAGRQAWKELNDQKFRFADNFYPAEFDSSFFAENIRHAYAGIDAKKINADLQRAKEQMKHFKMPELMIAPEAELNTQLNKLQLNKLFKELPAMALAGVLPDDVQEKIDDAMGKLQMMSENPRHKNLPRMKMRVDSLRMSSPFTPRMSRQKTEQELQNDDEAEMILLTPEPQRERTLRTPRIAPVPSTKPNPEMRAKQNVPGGYSFSWIPAARIKEIAAGNTGRKIKLTRAESELKARQEKKEIQLIETGIE
ncbi:MAG: family metallopeptidase, partial [Chitinophagaceae bacterium]|nr:family metallopeptidase [Chitinophagaceae bacterium]